MYPIRVFFVFCYLFCCSLFFFFFFFFFQAEDGIRDHCVTGVQTCALPISSAIWLLGFLRRRVSVREAFARPETKCARGCRSAPQLEQVAAGQSMQRGPRQHHRVLLRRRMVRGGATPRGTRRLDVSALIRVAAARPAWRPRYWTQPEDFLKPD